MGVLRTNKRMQSKPLERVAYTLLNGGLNTRATDLTKQQRPTTRLQSPYLLNVDFYNIQGFSTSNAYAQRGEAFATSTQVIGLKDYTIASGTGQVQKQVVGINNGGTTAEIWYHSGYLTSSTGAWTKIHTETVTTTRNDIFRMAILNKYLVIARNAIGKNRLWNGTEAATATESTMAHGYRPTVVATTPTASAGTGTWSATGDVKIMLITELVSGGYRASAPITVSVANTGHYIDVTATGGINSVHTAYHFDISSGATTVFATAPGGSVYYKVLGTRLTNFAGSSTTNPLHNDETAFRIQGATDATIAAQNTIEQEYTRTSAYMTGQVNTPDFKYVETGGNFCFGAGDPNNRSRVWISAAGEVNVWGDGSSSGADGDFVDVNEDDGQEITGIYWADSYLFVYKQRSIHRLEYSPGSGSWSQRMISPDIGCFGGQSMKKTPRGILFLTEAGGIGVHDSSGARSLAPERIGNLFISEATDTLAFTLSNLAGTTSAHYVQKMQIWWILPGSSGTRDTALIYSYDTDTFTVQKVLSNSFMNLVAEISNSKGQAEIWTGTDESASDTNKLLKMDHAAANATTEIAMDYRTPFLYFDDPDGWKDLHYIEVFGAKTSSSSTLTIKVYLDGATSVTYSTSLDMSDSRFETGLRVPIRGTCKNVKIRFDNSATVVPVTVYGFSVFFRRLGNRL